MPVELVNDLEVRVRIKGSSLMGLSVRNVALS